MALFLVTCVIDEGVYKNSFRVVEAASREKITKYMLDHYEFWEDFLLRSVFYIWLYDQKEGPVELWNRMNRVIVTREDSDKLENLFRSWLITLSPEALLKWIDRTRVDGDSSAQLAIHEIENIEKISDT